MTRQQFKRKAIQVFLKSNPPNTLIVWNKAERVTYPTGLKEWRGEFYASFPGYKPRVMTATGDETYMMVR